MIASLERRRAIFAGAVVLAGYGYFANVYERLPSPSATSRLAVTRALVDDGRLVRGPDAPGLSFLATPFYAAAKGIAALFDRELDHTSIELVVTYGVALLPTVLLCYFLFLMLVELLPPPRLRGLLILLYAMATPARIHATLLDGSQAAAVLAAGGALILFGLVRMRGWRGTAWALLAGLLAGAAFATDPASLGGIAGACVLAPFVARPWWRLLVFALGLGVPVALSFLYQMPTIALAASAPFFSLRDGLFVWAPWLLVAAPGLLPLAQNREWRPFFFAVLAAVLVGALTGGALALAPFLLFPAAAFIHRLARARWAAPRMLLSATAVYSLFAASFVAATYPELGPDVAHPLRDGALELFREGVLAPSLGSVLGLPGLWAALPYGIAIAALALIAASAWWDNVLMRAAGVLHAGAGAFVAVLLVLAARPEARDAAAAHEVHRVARALRPAPAADAAPRARGNEAMLEGRYADAVRLYLAGAAR